MDILIKSKQIRADNLVKKNKKIRLVQLFCFIYMNGYMGLIIGEFINTTKLSAFIFVFSIILASICSIFFDFNGEK